MSQFKTFGLLIVFAVVLVACSGNDGGLQLTENQHNLVGSNIVIDGGQTL